MNIVLVGYRGTGKSVVGQTLAQKLGLSYVEMDAEIISQARQTIPELVAAKGWDSFRDLESKVLLELTRRSGLVIDTGGGVIERTANHALLKEDNLVIWLTASLPVLEQRLTGCTQRPALTSGHSMIDEITTVLARREPLYRAVAHHRVDTDTQTPDELAQTIVGFYQTALQSSTPILTEV